MYYHTTIKGEKVVYWLMPIIIILFPTFPSVLPNLLGFQLIFIVEIVYVLICWVIGYFKPKYSIITNLIILYFLGATIFSIVIDLLKDVSILSDFFELVKPISFLLFFWQYKYSIIPTDKIIDYTYSALKVIYISLTVFSLLSFVYPDILRQIDFLLYKRSSVPILANKAIGSFSTTYHFAFFLLLPLSFTFIQLLKKPTIKRFLIFALILIAMLLTQSRSMYLCSVVCIGLSFCCPILHETIKQHMQTILIIGCVLMIAIMLFIQYHEYLYSSLTYAFMGLESMFEGGNNSVNVRQNQISWAFEHNIFMLIGSGVGKGEIMLESFYSLYYYRYGLIGMAISLILFLVTSFRSYKIASYYKENRYKVMFYALAVFYFIVPLSITSSCHMDSPKISLLFYGLIGLIFRKDNDLRIR